MTKKVKVERLNGKPITKADALKCLEAATTSEDKQVRDYLLGLADIIMCAAICNEGRGASLRGRPRRNRNDDGAALKTMKEIATETGEGRPWRLARLAAGPGATESDLDRLARRWKKSG